MSVVSSKLFLCGHTNTLLRTPNCSLNMYKGYGFLPITLMYQPYACVVSLVVYCVGANGGHSFATLKSILNFSWNELIRHGSRLKIRNKCLESLYI